MGMRSTEPTPPAFVRLYRQAFAEYGTHALWNKRVREEPTKEDALVIARALKATAPPATWRNRLSEPAVPLSNLQIAVLRLLAAHRGDEDACSPRTAMILDL
jgi:hypothetical protein